MPTDNQIKEEIREWVIALDGCGIVVTDEELLDEALDTSSFETVRELFPVNKQLLETLKFIINHWRANDQKYYESDLATEAIEVIRKAEKTNEI